MTPPDGSSKRRLAAVWFADIVGYTRLSAEDERAAIRLVEAFQHVCRAEVGRHGGRIIKFIGDATLAEFLSCEAAARAALSVREKFTASSPEDPALRIGVHVGAVVSAADGDVYGDGVNTASRIQCEAERGQILVTEDVWRQLRPLAEFSFGDVKRKNLRGMPHPVGVCELIGQAPQGAIRPGRLRKSLGRQVFRDIGARGRFIMAVAVILLIATVAWSGRGLWVPSKRPFPAASAVGFDPSRIAVLYFDDHSPGQQSGYLAAGLTEGLIHQLSQVDELDVVSRNGVKPFHGTAVPLDSIARALRVGSIVEGSVTRSGDRVRVTVQLIDATSGFHLASEELDHPYGEIIALQDSLVQQVAEILRRNLGREIRVRQTRGGTSNSEAYELLLRANAHQDDFKVLRTTDTNAGRRRLLQADSILARAERLDSNWVEPTLQRGWVARDLALLGGRLPGQHDPEWSEQALDHADRAVRLMPSDARTFELRGVVKQEYANSVAGQSRRDLARAAEEDLRRALELDDRRARAWWALSELLLSQGRFAEAKLAATHALRADSFLENVANVIHQIYYTAVQSGPDDESLAACNEGRRRFPDNTDFIVCQLFILASFPQVTADVDRAWMLADSLNALVPDDYLEKFEAFGRMLVAETAARAGLADSSRAIIRMARGDAPTPDWLAYNEAHARLLLGEPDSALAMLAYYLATNPDTAMVARDWWFTELRADSRFQRLIGQDR